MTSAAVAPLTDKDRLAAVIGVLLAMLLAALDQTIVAPAVPTIAASLGGLEYVSWIVSAYLVTATAVTPLYGKFADIHGRRTVLFIGVGIFVVGSIICALSTSMLMLILGRAVQGLGGGGLVALAQTVIGDVVPPRERGRYTGYISTIWATASIAGPVLGGFFSEHLHWSLIFWINLPLAAIAVAVVNRSLGRLPQHRKAHRLDVLGCILMVTTTVLVMLVLTWGGVRYPWTSPLILGLGATAAVFGVAFVWQMLRAEEPLIPLEVLRNPILANGVLTMFFATGAFIGMSVYVPIYLETVLGLGSSTAGLSLVALMAATVVGANFAGRSMLHLEHYKRVALGGLALATASVVALAAVASWPPSLALFETLLATAGIGLGMLFPIITVSVQNAVERTHLGIATAVLAFLRSLGGAIGVAVMGAVVLASGAVRDLAAPGGGAADPAARVAAGHAFSTLFAGAAISIVIGLVFLLRMQEKPLRGHETPRSAPAE